MDRYTVIDLETTGQSPAKGDKIIEVGINVIENNEIVDEYATFLNPGMPIPEFITNLTGIDDKDVASAPFFSEKAEEITAFFKDSYLVAHNVPFDLGFLNGELKNIGLEGLKKPVIDTVELSRILFPKAPSFKLSQLTEFLDIHHDDPHRAASDAYVTAKLLIKLKNKLTTMPYETVDHLIKLEKSLKSDLYPLLQEQLDKSAFSASNPPGIETYRGLAFKQIEETEKEDLHIDTSFGDYLDHIYEENGALEQTLPGYEKREGQREMSEIIHDAFQMHHHALIEAETGTGKSLAYLLPSVYEALRTKKRLVVSTFTTQLQSQLLEEEIPLIRELLGLPFSIALLKGKNHYISLEKFEKELAETDHDNYDIALTKAMILVWLTETDTGDIDEIHLPASGYLFYQRVSTDKEGYTDTYSPWFKKSYYQKAKKSAQKADIIVTNHALICTDMFNDYEILPAYEKIIIDEAHHFQEIAASHYGLKIDYANMLYTLNQIGLHGEESKLFSKILQQLQGDTDHLPLSKWDEILLHAKNEIDDVFRQIFQYVIEQSNRNKSLSDVGRTQYRFENEKEKSDQWGLIIDMVTRLIFYLRDLIHILSMTEESFAKQENFDKMDRDELKGHMETVQLFIDRLEHLFLTEDSNDQVKWIEIEASGAKNAVYLYSEPIDMSKFLSNDFFNKKDSVILTSATLTMKKSFSFIQNELGIDKERLVTRKIDSPFSYQSQVQLLIPNDFPDIKYGKQEDFIYATSEAILSLAEVTSGRMLVLFTSYDMLRKTYYILKENLESHPFVLLAQGISSSSRSRLKKNFQTFEQAILLGTSSFWEGVDIPGDDLSALMIVRLPFQPPDHPKYEAKSAYLKAAGRNAFMELALPHAVIRFKQGFGRLIRSKRDRGIVFICDTRIINARYGKYFIDSIPDVPLTNTSTKELMEKAKDWF
ncbi:ATP-dependent DNA helicase DinG [Virgibacillus sp. YIM 98842]|jgi:ATP-dependent DNA helicase DinG|uniref:ATP-dependent DNA helicase DinG n=1 Tax=Virgibacillus sp. YIM 98842 TaxID=2663533 RepID=UPI0013DD5D10|nr:ATP-dependent DNA helicase DinG [Virgibacillus sp. YIM 98842]